MWRDRLVTSQQPISHDLGSWKLHGSSGGPMVVDKVVVIATVAAVGVAVEIEVVVGAAA